MNSYVSQRFRSVIITLFLFVALSVVGASHQAKAATTTWSLQNASFGDGGTISGMFNWDTDLNSLLSWNFTVAGGNTTDFPSPFTFSNTLANNIGQYLDSADVLRFYDTTFSTTQPREIRFGLLDPDSLDIPVAMLALDPVGASGPTGYVECFNCDPIRLGVDGAYLSAVPVPAAVWLFSTALIGFVGMSRRRKVA
jgi:hypothetical protein